MARIGWRTCWFGLLLFGCSALLSAQEITARDTRLVSMLGQHPRIEFQGCKAIEPNKILRELNRDPDYQAILFSYAPLHAFQDQLAASVREQYLSHGFARATIAVKFIESGNEDLFAATDIKVLVEVQEGDIYPAGRIELHGIQTVDEQLLLSGLQEAGNSITDLSSLKSETIQRPEAAPMDRKVPLPSAETTEGMPCWKAGLVIPSPERAIKKITIGVKILLAQQGLVWPRVSVEIEPRDDSKTSVLVINLEREGPRATVGKIELSGQSRNSTESILKLLDLPIGSKFNADVFETACERLYRSARFQKFDLKFDRVNPPDDGAVTFTLEVNENEHVPLLTDRLSEEQEVLLKFGRWQEVWGKLKTPYRISVVDCPIDILARLGTTNKNKRTVVDIEFTFIPQQAIYLSWRLKPAGDPRGHRTFHILFGVNEIDCVFPIQRLRLKFANPLSLPGSTYQLILYHVIKPIAEPKTKDGQLTTVLACNLKSNNRRRPETSAIQFEAEIAPVTMLDLHAKTNAKSHFEGSELVLEWNENIFRIERRTGELNSFTSAVSKGLNNPVDIRKDSGAVQRIHDFMNAESQGFQIWTGDQSSIACALALLWNQIDTRQPIGLANSNLLSMRWFESVIREAVTSHTRKSDVPVEAIGEEELIFPNRHRMHFEKASNSLSVICGMTLLWNYQAFFQDKSPFGDMSRFVAVTFNRGFVSREFRPEKAATSELGPLSQLYGTLLLHTLQPKASAELATAGKKSLNTIRFSQEIRELTFDNSVSSEAILIAAKKLAKFSNEELTQFTNQLGISEHQALLAEIRQELANATDEQQFREATVAALVRLWDPVIRPRLRTALETFTPPPASKAPGSSKPKEEIKKQGEATKLFPSLFTEELFTTPDSPGPSPSEAVFPIEAASKKLDPEFPQIELSPSLITEKIGPKPN